MTKNPDYIRMAVSHLDRLIAAGASIPSPFPNAMWPSSVDIETGAYPLDDSRPPNIGKRVYRNIDAPRGVSLYWDQPQAAAACAASAITGESRYREAAEAYTRAFLERCVARNGMFLWGNHYYYDFDRNSVMRFHGKEPPAPCDMANEQGELHEARPIPPALDLFFNVDPGAAERFIRAAAERHVFDPETGGFNRHADGEKSHAFLEAGAILAGMLCALFARTGDASLRERALRIARYSFSHRSDKTGLIENNPTYDRWDKLVCTTEAGLWAGCMLRAAKLTGTGEFVAMADEVVSAYLRRGFDANSGRFYGRLRVADGTPDLSEKTTPYQPGAYSDLWQPLFPTHDYPMCMAEACLELMKTTGAARFEQGVRQWIRAVEAQIPAGEGKGAYAEHYGRCIHFLAGAAAALDDKHAMNMAERVAEDAVARLYGNGMFRGHPGENRYDAVDGVGFLLLALFRLARGRAPEYAGFGF